MNFGRSVLFVLFIGLGWVPASGAGIFNIPYFVEPGDFSIGLEPEVTLINNDAGVGMNFKYTHGVSDLINLQGTLGTGSGGRGFRAGLGAVFDFFPDYGMQPGVGIATQTFYYRTPVGGRGEFTVVPYLHKTFFSGKHEFDPFISVPFGLGVTDEGVDTLVSVALGSRFKGGEKVSFLFEVGVAVNHTNSYFSGGAIYHY